MSLYDNEENAIVNNDNDVSETPSNLVNESPDQEYNKNGAKLSPNPAGFGFIKQLFVTPENTATNGEPNLPGEPNVLYLVQVINDGVLVGFRKYKWTPSDGFVQFGATPDLKLKDSPRETPTRVENEPKKNLAQVFNGDIAVNGDLFVKGQKVQGSSDPLTPSQVVDIVNEGIEGGDINVVANPTLAGTEDALTGLQVGNAKYKVGGGNSKHAYLFSVNSGIYASTFTYYTDNDNITDKNYLLADLKSRGYLDSSNGCWIQGSSYFTGANNGVRIRVMKSIFTNSSANTLYLNNHYLDLSVVDGALSTTTGSTYDEISLVTLRAKLY